MHPLNLIFALEEKSNSPSLNNVIYEEAVSYYPSFADGQLLSFAQYDMENTTAKPQTYAYKVTGTLYSIHVNTGKDNSLSIHQLIIFLRELPPKETGDFEVDFV